MFMTKKKANEQHKRKGMSQSNKNSFPLNNNKKVKSDFHDKLLSLKDKITWRQNARKRRGKNQLDKGKEKKQQRKIKPTCKGSLHLKL